MRKRRWSTPSGGLLVLALVGIAGCPRSKRHLQDALQAALARSDAAWAARGRDGFDPVREALDAADRLHPDDPEVQWRKVRLAVGQGLAASNDREALRLYAVGRDVAVGCYTAGVAFDATAAPRAIVDGLKEQGASRRGCVEWGTLAWARWLADFGGAGGAIDLVRLDALLQWSAAHPMNDPGDLVGLRDWSAGLVYAVRPQAEGRDLARARDALLRAIRERPADVAIHVDLIRYVAEPLHDESLVARQERQVQTAAAVTPEDRRAVARLAEMASP